MCGEKFLTEKKKNGQIKGMINMKMLILSYTKQQAIAKIVQNFKILGAAVPEKSLTKNFIEEKEKMDKLRE